ncbi:MAG: IPT/TIG domain-containing protein, partial [Candidatus Falkowbacteria bacterium]
MVVKFKKLLFLTIFTGILLLGNFVNAQQPLTSDTAFGGKTGETAETLAGTAGVGTSDPRLIASRIINISLGFLGIIAVAIIIYAGFLWMTAQGNMEQIDRAKKILTGGVIGLVIILSAFGIASLVLRLLFGASGGTGSGGSTGTGTGSGIGGGSVEFEINSTYPTENQTDVIRNVVITYQFNMGVSDKDLEENFKVYYLIEEDGGKEEIEVEGTRTVKGNVLEFIPNSDCADAGEEYKDRQCFDKNTNIIVRAKDGILSLSKKSLACSSLNTGWPCKLEFSVGEKIDVSPPVITKFSVGKQACANPNNAVEIEATDDTDVKLIELYVSLVGTAIAVPTSSELNSSSLTFEWDGSGFNNGDVVDLKVVVHDADSNTAEDTKQLTISDDINCDNTSHVSPIIDWVNPEDGAPGNLVTIGGRYFGERDANSKVYFSCSGSADPRCSEVDGQWTIKAKLAWDINPRCTGDWTNNRIIAVIPEGVTDGPIKVEKINTEGEKLSGTSNDFDVNATVRPGLCKVDPMSQKVGEVIALHGINLGISGDAENVVFGYDDQEMRSSAVTWGSDNKTITSVTIPVIKTATTSIRVKQGLEYSNPIDFRAETSANQPLITKVEPNSGNEGDYITIYGSNFGSNGTVRFRNETADTNFPAECSIDDIWRDTRIIVKVPTGLNNSNKVDISVTTGGLTDVLENGFEKENGSPNPGLCKIDPLSGPEGTEVSLYGENFGSQGEVTFYNNESATVSNWTTSGTGADTAVASVPEGAQSGPVKVSGSNGLNFNVESCLNDNQQVIPNFCGTGERSAICCTANTQNAGACVANYQACGVDPESQYAQYYFEFSTEIVGGNGKQFTAPKVIEECDRQNNQCNDQATPSPSPWTPRWDRILDRPLACTNSIITARFDKNMDRTTLNSDNIKLFRCDDAEDDDSKGKDCDQVEITNNSIVT